MTKIKQKDRHFKQRHKNKNKGLSPVYNIIDEDEI